MTRRLDYRREPNIVLGLADTLGWDVVHPMLDDAVSEIAAAARANGGTLRAVWGDSCFLTFATPRGALDAFATWQAKLGATSEIASRTKIAMHFGEVRLMRHTTMGADVHVAETLCDVTRPGEVLVTDEIRELLAGSIALEARAIERPTSKWHRYSTRKVWRVAGFPGSLQG